MTEFTRAAQDLRRHYLGGTTLFDKDIEAIESEAATRYRTQLRERVLLTPAFGRDAIAYKEMVLEIIESLAA